MTFQIPAAEELANESDVEQKFIYPLLRASLPYGLGLSDSVIQTKANIRRFKIGKGSDEKLYFPDYLIVFAGLPLVVIEAKEPGCDLQAGYREARLYAAELNAAFPSGQNPIFFVVATNGEQLWAGPPDQQAPKYQYDYGDLNSYSEGLATLQKTIGAPALQAEFARLMAKLKPAVLKKPRRMLGGLSIQHEEVGHNTFGATISADFGFIFNPNSRQHRAFIARHGYVPSKRRERYIDPIDRVIRASRPPSEVEARPIEDTSTPTEIVKVFKDPKPLEHQVLLIVGSVGAGKSTFVDYLQEVALPRELIEQTIWIRLNMNTAPLSVAEIYDWLRVQIIGGCREAYPELDFDELEVLEKIYAVEINKFKKGPGRLYETDKTAYQQKLAAVIETAMTDLDLSVKAHCRYCSSERGKLLVVVLDNCDKRLRDEQLLMFEAAQWIQKEFRALVILPLREETYDNHRDQPPLDAALKDLVFRIEPPLFHNVLVKRVQLVLNQLAKHGAKTLGYDLPNGFHVEYPATEQAYYLTSILRSIFEYDRQIRRMIVGLSGRSIRRALEIFLEFCTSGHITEDQIFRITQNAGTYTLPLFLVTRVLLRMNRRYYDGDHSYVKNILDANRLDERPFYFTRLMILRWLHARFNQVGPSGFRGYFRIGDLKTALAGYGIEEKMITREMEYLAKAQCVISEDFRAEGLADGDLIRLAPAGFVQLDFLGNVNYLAAVAEDTAFADEALAERVAARITQLETQYEIQTALTNARELVQYLDTVRLQDATAAATFLENSEFESLTDLANAKTAVQKLEQNVIIGGWVDSEARYPVGREVEGSIATVKPYGLFVDLEPGVSGLVHKSKNLPYGFETDQNLMAGERIRVRVLRVDPIAQKVELAYVGLAPED
jgi:hypothetical protein